jgi:hypothetical protein
MAALGGPQYIGYPSLLAIFSAATVTTGDTFIPNGKSFVTVKNGSGVSVTATVDVPGNDAYGNAKGDLVVTVAAGTERDIPITSADFVQSDGTVKLTCSPVTSVTVAHKSM